MIIGNGTVGAKFYFKAWKKHIPRPRAVFVLHRPVGYTRVEKLSSIYVVIVVVGNQLFWTLRWPGDIVHEKLICSRRHRNCTTIHCSSYLWVYSRRDDKRKGRASGYMTVTNSELVLTKQNLQLRGFLYSKSPSRHGMIWLENGLSLWGYSLWYL